MELGVCSSIAYSPVVLGSLCIAVLLVSFCPTTSAGPSYVSPHAGCTFLTLCTGKGKRHRASRPWSVHRDHGLSTANESLQYAVRTWPPLHRGPAARTSTWAGHRRRWLAHFAYRCLPRPATLRLLGKPISYGSAPENLRTRPQ